MHWNRRVADSLKYLTIFLALAEAFYLPGYSQNRYKDGESIPLLLRKISSQQNPVEHAYLDLPFVCPPRSEREIDGYLSGPAHPTPSSIWEAVRRGRFPASSLEVNMKEDVECRRLCDRVMSRKDVQQAQRLIQDGYVVEWILDDLPALRPFLSFDRTKNYISQGFKMGDTRLDLVSGQLRPVLNNHFTLVVRWRDAQGGSGRRVIVGFEIYAHSVANSTTLANRCAGDGLEHDNLQLYIPPNRTELMAKYPGSSYIPEALGSIDDGATLVVPYTYSVYFREDQSIDWTHRRDRYPTTEAKSTATHWLAMLSSLTISGLLGAMVLVLLGRISHLSSRRMGNFFAETVTRARTREVGPEKAFSQAGLLDSHDGKGDDLIPEHHARIELTGPDMFENDVFRPPAYAGLFAPLVGLGVQVLLMATSLLVSGWLGLIRRNASGTLTALAVCVFWLVGFASGYCSARIYKLSRGADWRRNSVLTALLCPALLFWFGVLVNLLFWTQASIVALPTGTLVSLTFWWLVGQIPVVFASGWYGNSRTDSWRHPIQSHLEPRQLPRQPWYSRGITGPLLSGLISFAVVYPEVRYILRRLWDEGAISSYGLGFVSGKGILVMLTVGEMGIISTYYQLSAENHRWWWRSFSIGGASGGWIFVYCVWFSTSKLGPWAFISSLLFLSSTLLVCAAYSLMSGTISFLAAYALVRRLFRSDPF